MWCSRLVSQILVPFQRGTPPVNASPLPCGELPCHAIALATAGHPLLLVLLHFLAERFRPDPVWFATVPAPFIKYRVHGPVLACPRNPRNQSPFPEWIRNSQECASYLQFHFQCKLVNSTSFLHTSTADLSVIPELSYLCGDGFSINGTECKTVRLP